MDEKKMLGVLMHTTDQQSQMTEKLLVQLKMHVAALEAATKSAQEAIPAIKKATGDAATAAVGNAMANATGIATTAINEASKPFLGKLQTAAEAAGAAEAQIRAAGLWFGWRVGAVAAGAIAVAGLLGWAAIWWERSQVVTLLEQKAALQQEVSQLTAQAEDLAKRGDRIKLSTCGPSGRLCVLASPNQGGSWQAPWADATGKQMYVIPQGY